MKAEFASALVATALLAWATPTLAHHPFAAEYDRTKPMQLTGIVSKVDWTNPHAMLWLDVKEDEKGKTGTWTIELGGPNALRRRGWTEKIVKAGDQVTVNGWMAREDTHRGNAKTLTLSNGKELNAASSFFEKSPPKSKNSH